MDNEKDQGSSLFDKLEVWENADHPVQISAGENGDIHEYLKQIHNNPVRNKIVESPEDYLHSSAKNYAGLNGLVNIQNPRQKNEADAPIYKIPIHNAPVAKGSEYFSY
jgi:hypothetical protein